MAKKTRLEASTERFAAYDPAQPTAKLLELLEEDLRDEDQVAEAFETHRLAARRRAEQG